MWITVLTAAILTLLAAGLYLVYEGAALEEEDRARKANRQPRFVTISAIVRAWQVKNRSLFWTVCAAWVAFGVWFAIHITLNCCP